MRGLIIAAIVVVCLALLGWLSFADYDDKSTITFDKQEMKEDTKETIETSKDVVNEITNDAEDALDEANDEADVDEAGQEDASGIEAEEKPELQPVEP